MDSLSIVNYLYLDGEPFGVGFNFGTGGFDVLFVSRVGLLSRSIHYNSFIAFCSCFDDYLSRLSLGTPFPVNPSSSDVK